MSKSKTKPSLSYLKTFFDEKEIDREHVFEVKAPGGTPNWIPAGCVIDTILIAPKGEQEQIANMLRKIDFANGNVLDFLGHLAKAIAYDL